MIFNFVYFVISAHKSLLVYVASVLESLFSKKVIFHIFFCFVTLGDFFFVFFFCSYQVCFVYGAIFYVTCSVKGFKM